MKKSCTFLILFFISFFCHAESPDVVSWTEKTLMNTLTVNYQDLTEQLKVSQTNYSPEAWSALESFFSGKKAVIMDNKLSIHPKPLYAAILTDYGTISDVTYWKIIQAVSIPELNMNATFTLTVIKNKNSPYLIQSVNVINTVY